MTITPLLDAGFIIASHAIAALIAFFIGTIQLIAPKGTMAHRALGYLWVVLMLWVAAASFWIHEIRILGDWSPIHLLSILTLLTVPLAIFAARTGRIETHKRAMRSLYFFALMIAGLFTLFPGRIMHQVVFGLTSS